MPAALCGGGLAHARFTSARWYNTKMTALWDMLDQAKADVVLQSTSTNTSPL
jgi:hypothetical protein